MYLFSCFAFWVESLPWHTFRLVCYHHLILGCLWLHPLCYKHLSLYNSVKSFGFSSYFLCLYETLPSKILFFLFVPAFCPYHIGHFTLVGLKIDEFVSWTISFLFSLLSRILFSFASLYLLLILFHMVSFFNYHSFFNLLFLSFFCFLCTSILIKILLLLM